MKRLLRRIRSYMPHRRRRRWRYVSGRRRRRGLVLMALIIVGVWGWYHFTNDARIKRKAVAYLQRLTGVEVRIQHASFSVFEGIQLEGVRIFHQADGRVENILQARQVRLEYRPLSLLRAGRLAVTEITCVEPELTITENVDQGTWNYQRLFGGVALTGGSGGAELPTIRIRDGRVIRKEILHGAMIPLCVEKLSAHAVPVAGVRMYRIEVRGDEASEPVRAAATLSLSPVTFTWEGDVPGALLQRTLPHGYRQWWEAWQVGGVFSFAGTGGGMAGDRLVLTLTEATMTLPIGDGDIELAGLNGRIVLTRQGVDDVNVTGVLPKLAGASVSVTGHFAGFTRTSPMVIHVDVGDLTFPMTVEEGPLGRVLGELQRDFSPVGRMVMAVDVIRDEQAGGSDAPAVRYQGTARPEQLAITVGYFPAPLTDLTGEVRFDSRRIVLESLQGRFGETRATVTGSIAIGDPLDFDVSVEARQLVLGDTLDEILGASTLPVISESVRFYRDQFALAGTGDLSVRVFTGEDGRVASEVDMTFDGNASAAFAVFPYRLEGLTGTVKARGDGIVVNALRGGRGKARVRLDGVVNGWDQAKGFTMRIKAWDVALDEHLGTAIDALTPLARQQYDAFALNGVTDIDGALSQAGDGPVEYDLTATLKSASMEYAPFPYRLDEVFGELRFTPDGVALKRMAGRHGRGRVQATGRVNLYRDEASGPTVRAIPELVIDARQIACDADLQRAVEGSSSDAGDLWTLLQPTGEADIRFELRDGGGKDFFPLQITARNMSVTYHDFPYPLSNVRGRILARADRVELHDVVAGSEEASITLTGGIDIDGGAVQLADMTLDAVGVPIDSALLDAAPEGLDAVTSLFRPGGTWDLHTSRLQYRALPPAPDEPATEPQPPTDPPDGPWRWTVDGEVLLHGAVLQAGVPATDVEGRIAGAVQADDGRGGLRVTASMAAESLQLWGRKAERFSGKIVKEAAEPQLRLEKLGTRFCGGRLGGNITVELGSPSRYTVALLIEKAQLADLLNVDPAAGDANASTSGEFSGRLELIETVGRADRREGRGRFRLSGARIAKVPVLLGLMNVALLQLPNESAFSSGEMDYYIKGDRLFCDRIYLEGSNRSVVGLSSSPTSVVGRGVVDMKTEQLNLVFRSGPPGLLGGMVFGQLWELTAEGIYNTHITGPWRSPQVRPVMFRQVETLLKEIGGVE